LRSEIRLIRVWAAHVLEQSIEFLRRWILSVSVAPRRGDELVASENVNPTPRDLANLRRLFGVERDSERERSENPRAGNDGCYRDEKVVIVKGPYAGVALAVESAGDPGKVRARHTFIRS
jgi:hypothetical protein